MPINGGEREGADVEGVARVILQLHLVAALLLAQRQHLPRLRCYLHSTRTHIPLVSKFSRKTSFPRQPTSVGQMCTLFLQVLPLAL